MVHVIGTGDPDSISPFSVSPGVIGIPALNAPNTIEGGSGADSIAGGRASDLILGNNGDDWLLANAVVASQFGPDTIIGGNGDDFLSGGAGLFGGAGTVGHSLFGGSGRDTLIGGDTELASSNDYLDGGPGDDLLDGLKGTDTLLGGAGDDVFRFHIGIVGPAPVSTTRPGDGSRDVILDFRQGADVIDLSTYQTFFEVGATVAPDDPVFLGTSPFGTSTGLQVRYTFEADNTIVQFQSAVNQTWYLPTLGEIELRGHIDLTADDFIL